MQRLSFMVVPSFFFRQNGIMKSKKLFVVGAGIFIATSVFLFPSFEKTFAGWAWGIFVAVMMVRPFFELVQRFPLLSPKIWERVQMGDRVLSELILRIKFIATLFQKGGITGIWDFKKKLLFLAMQWRREMGDIGSSVCFGAW
jgi:hypothetical protein